MAAVELWERIRETWRLSGAGLRARVSAAHVEAFERCYRVVLPVDVRTYLQTVDGTGRDHLEGGMNSFWPLADIVPVHVALDDRDGFVHSERWSFPDCFVFADHMVESWWYAVKLTADPTQPAPVYVVGKTDGGQVSNSFAEFMTRYANDPQSIW